MDFKPIFQMVPTGSYYNTQEEQKNKCDELLNGFLEHDRIIFALSLLLNSTSYSKGLMMLKLLNNSYVNSDVCKSNEIIEYGLNHDYEVEIILHFLRKDTMARSLKNLLLMKKYDKTNNSRARKIILRYLFEGRDNDSLQNMVIRYKEKVKELIRHALGENETKKMLLGVNNINMVNKYNNSAYEILRFINNKSFDNQKYAILDLYKQVSDSAKEKAIDKFLELAGVKKLPFEVLMGHKNCHKLQVDINKIYEKGKMSEVQKSQNIRSSQRVGVDSIAKEIDYKKKNIYDLLKLLYTAVLDGGIDKDTMIKIDEAICHNCNKDRIDLGIGNITVLFDLSDSMKGSDKRLYHPLLTGLSLLFKLDNVERVVYCGGRSVDTGLQNNDYILVPEGPTQLHKAFIEAVGDGNTTVLIISDGYENQIEGLLNIVYNELKKDGKVFNVLHVNPVFSSESCSRKLIDDINPMSIDRYEMLYTNIIFEMIMQDKIKAKEMLAKKYKKLLTMG